MTLDDGNMAVRAPRAYSRVAPFPRERFLKFCSQLKVQSKDYGLVPFNLLGTQLYVLDEMCKGLDAGITVFVILKARQIGMCHDPDMRVLTADLKWTRIGDVQIDDELVATDEHAIGARRARCLRTATVLGRKEVESPAVKILLDNGTMLIATPQHPYLCRRRGGTDAEWRCVEKLRLGDEIRGLATPWQESHLEDAWMGGLIDGEGSLRQKQRAGCELSISQIEGPVLDRARAYLQSRGYSWREEIDDRQPGTSSKLGRKPVHKLVIGRINELFRLLGQTRPQRFLGSRWWNDKELPGKIVGAPWHRVVGLRELPSRTMVDLHTSTGTYICEGVVSHNTTFFLALDIFWAFEHKGLLGTFILHKEEARDDWRAAIEVFLAEIPKPYKVPKLAHNRNILSWKNGSRFRYLIAGTSENRKGGLGRSGASNFVHGTEIAFYGNEEDLRSFKSATTSIYPHRLQVWESTANGFNHFNDTWEEAKASPVRRAIFVGWWRDERNQFPTDHPYFDAYMPEGIASGLTVIERKRVRAVRELYDFRISVQQIAWYRWKLHDEFDGDQSMMDQEFPWTEDDAFQATGAKYFTVDSLSDAIKIAKRSPFQTYRYHLTRRWDETRVVGVRDPRAELRIWQEASKFGRYAVACDPAYGSSEGADNTCIQVWRAYSDCLEQVAEFATNEVSTYQCAWVLAHLAGYYKTGNVIIEITGPGGSVWQELQQLREYTKEIKPTSDASPFRNCLVTMREYFYQKIDNVGGGELARQWRSTHDLRSRMLANFKNSFELGRLIVRSVPLLEEMRKVVNDDGHVAAEGRNKDDRVITAGLANEVWRMWMQRTLQNQGLSRLASEAIDARGGPAPIDQLIRNFMKRQNIAVGY